ncbi:hypothetical protein [uncultured archaeal virus]|uniref:Uncharacterized protein n=1 Tax=uncultured archaeal virus TaxID=1960247 RepID=A0A8B0LNL7_9VIRU|nr:hypothetical protein [uncultured archaeal virus]
MPNSVSRYELGKIVETYGAFGNPDGIQDDMRNYISYFLRGKKGNLILKSRKVSGKKKGEQVSLTYEWLLHHNNYLRFNFLISLNAVNEKVFNNLLLLSKYLKIDNYISFFVNKKINVKKLSEYVKERIKHYKVLIKEFNFQKFRFLGTLKKTKNPEMIIVYKQKYKNVLHKIALYKRLLKIFENLFLNKQEFIQIIDMMYDNRKNNVINPDVAKKLLSDINFSKKVNVNEYSGKALSTLKRKYLEPTVYVADMLLLFENTSYAIRGEKVIYYDDGNLGIYELTDFIKQFLIKVGYLFEFVKIYNIIEYKVEGFNKESKG